MDLTAVLAGLSGAVLVWCALRNKHPIKVVQLALSGGDPNTAPPFTAATDSPAGFTGKGEAELPAGAVEELPEGPIYT